MFTYKHRSTTPEIMDDPSTSAQDLQAALRDISVANRFLGGNAITFDGIQQLLDQYPEKKDWVIADVGCGEGEILRRLCRRFRESGYTIKAIGLDLNKRSIEYAKRASADFDNLSFKAVDILNDTVVHCDIVICTLTLHHLSDQVIVDFLTTFQKMASVGIVINDLQRSKLAAVSFKVFSRIFMRSDIARHDGLVSIQSSFTGDDLAGYAKKSGIKSYQLNWRWAFRWQWIIKI